MTKIIADTSIRAIKYVGFIGAISGLAKQYEKKPENIKKDNTINNEFLKNIKREHPHII